jgi:hypothetical protein
LKSPAPRFDGVVFYGVSYGEPNPIVGDVVEFFLRREQAEQFIAEGLEDEPEWAGALSVVEVEFEVAVN